MKTKREKEESQVEGKQKQGKGIRKGKRNGN